MPSEYSMYQREENIMDMVNPYSLWFDSFFWKWQAMKMAPLGARMIGPMANETKWAKMIHAPLGTRSLIYPWQSPERRSFFEKLNKRLENPNLANVEREAIRRQMYEGILTKEALQDAKGLQTKEDRIRGRMKDWSKQRRHRMRAGGLTAGFFIGQMAGSAFGLDTGGQIIAGGVGAGLAKYSGGLAPTFYKLGQKGLPGGEGVGKLLAQLSFGPSIDTGRQIFGRFFGARTGFEDLTTELSRRFATLDDIYQDIVKTKGTFQTAVRTQQVKTIPWHKAGKMRLAANLVPIADPTGATYGVLEDIIEQKTRTVPGLPFTVGEIDAKGMMNRSVRESVFGRYDERTGKVRGRWSNLWITETKMKQRLIDSIAKEMEGKLLNHAKTGNWDLIKEHFKDKKGIFEGVDNRYTTAREAKLADRKVYEGIRKYVTSEEGRRVILQRATEAVDTRAGTVASREITRMAKLTRRAALGGIVVGTATAGVLAAQAVMATYKYAIEGMNVVSETMRSLSRHEFGSGFAVETPQATSERAMAMQSIQNAMGMGRSLLGGEAAYVH